MNPPNFPGPVAPDAEGSASAETSFADILTEFEQEQHAAAAEPGGETLEGVVISVQPDAVYVDIGRKHEGVLPAEHVRDASGGIRLKAGDKIAVSVSGFDENGYHRLSVTKVVVPRDWSGLQKAFDEKAVVTGTVEEVVKGGLRVDIGVRAFMPASRSGARDVPDMEKLVGQQIECRITKLDTEKEDVVVDRRVILEEAAAKAREAAFDALQEGAIVEGTVRSVMDYGAFVDLGGVDGLLHVADMTWVRGTKPQDVVKSGDSVRVKILKVQRDSRKISLGLKQLSADPWTAAAEAYKPGDRVKGKVVRLADFGAFVELQPGVEGLIHVSEMSWSRKQKRPADIVSAGEMVETVVLSVNAAERRIGLGLKQALGDPWEDAVRKFPVGAIVDAPVRNLANFGAFVEIAEGIEGMIHIGDIAQGKRLQHPKEALSTGQVVRAQVLEVDNERRRFRLGMRQLEPTSVDVYIAEHKVGDQITGRVVEVKGDRARVELADGVTASCVLRAAAPTSANPTGSSAGADLGSLTAMLAAKWKQGSVGGGRSEQGGWRAGQVKEFRISGLDGSAKRIEVEAVD